MIPKERYTFPQFTHRGKENKRKLCVEKFHALSTSIKDACSNLIVYASQMSKHELISKNGVYLYGSYYCVWWRCSDLFVFIFILPPFNGKLMFHLIRGNKNVSKIEIAVIFFPFVYCMSLFELCALLHRYSVNTETMKKRGKKIGMLTCSICRKYKQSDKIDTQGTTNT